MSKKIEPIDFIVKKPGMFTDDSYTNFINRNNGNKIEDAGDRFIAILQTQEYDEKTGEIIDIPDNSIEEQKQTQIEINSEKCRLAIFKFLGVDNEEDAKIRQLNMLLEEATKGKNATKALKEYQVKKEKYRQINKELKEKINNATTIDEIKSYDFDEKIKEIGEIEDL